MNNIEIDFAGKLFGLVTALIGLSIAIRSVVSQRLGSQQVPDSGERLKLIKADLLPHELATDIRVFELKRTTRRMKQNRKASAFYLCVILFDCLMTWLFLPFRESNFSYFVQFGNWASAAWFLYVAFANHQSRQLLTWFLNQSYGTDATDFCEKIVVEALFKASLDEVISCCYKACRNLEADLLRVEVNDHSGTGYMVISKISYKLGYAFPAYPRERLKVTVERVGENEHKVRLETPLVRRNSYGFPGIFLHQLYG